MEDTKKSVSMKVLNILDKFGMDIGDKVLYPSKIKHIHGKLPVIGEFCSILAPQTLKVK